MGVGGKGHAFLSPGKFRERILVLDPNAGIRTHARLVHLLASVFARNADVLLLRCAGSLSGGCSLHLSDLGADREKMCGNCQSHARVIDSGAEYSLDYIDSHIGPRDTEWARSIVGEKSLDELRSFSYLGAPIGSYASYELLLGLKIGELGVEDLEHFRKAVFAALVGAIAAREVVGSFGPDIVLTFGRQYGVQRVFCSIAHKMGIPTASIGTYGTHDNRERGFQVSYLDHELHTHLDERFSESMRAPVSRREGKRILSHFNVASNGKSIFSYTSPRRDTSKKEIYDDLGLRSDKAVIAVIISSPDEPSAALAARYLHPALTPPNDLQYLGLAIEAVRALPQVQFVFRLHPRLFSNRRESIRSPWASELVGLLEQEKLKLPNLFLNVPGDSIGLFDLARILDGAISYRSNAGQELGILGVPLIQLDSNRDPIRAFRKSFVHPSTVRQLVEEVETLLENPQDSEQQRMLLRWMVTDRLRFPVSIRVSRVREVVLKILIRFSTVAKTRYEGMGLYLGVTKIGGQKIGNIGSATETLDRWISRLELPSRSDLKGEEFVARQLTRRFLER